MTGKNANIMNKLMATSPSKVWRFILLVLLPFFSFQWTFAQLPGTIRTMADIKKSYEKKEVYVTMRDGIRLFTSIYSPRDHKVAYPILLLRTPYNSEPDKNNYSERLMEILQLLKEGYIIVYQDVRGCYMSEGTYMDVRPFKPDKGTNDTDENSDTFDTIDWLVKNTENNNGKVGVFGISYPGFYSTISIPDAHPALKAVSPQAPVTNWFLGDDWHHHGAFFLMDAFSFYYGSGFGRPRPVPTRNHTEVIKFNRDDNYDFFLDFGPIKNIGERYKKDTVHFWRQLMNHPDYDDFWEKRDPTPYLVNIKPAVLVVGGWFDAEDLPGPLHVYGSIEKQNTGNSSRLVMGPWSHGQWERGKGTNLGNIYWGSSTSAYFKELELKFFNYYLKGKGTMDLPEATIFITGSNVWKGFDHWPPERTRKENLYLAPGGKIIHDAPASSESYDEYMSDPAKPVPYTEDVHWERTTTYMTDDQRFAARRPDVMVYESDVLTMDMTVTGAVGVDLFVSTSGTDADYVVKLIDAFPDQVADYPGNEKNVPMGGYEMLVRGDVLRGRYRNSYENPEPFTPGKVTEIAFSMPDIAHTFQKGHRIMIQVQHSWFPLVDRNPQQFVNIYQCDEKDFIKATQRIYHDAVRPSHFTLPVLSN